MGSKVRNETVVLELTPLAKEDDYKMEVNAGNQVGWNGDNGLERVEMKERGTGFRVSLMGQEHDNLQSRAKREVALHKHSQETHLS